MRKFHHSAALAAWLILVVGLVACGSRASGGANAADEELREYLVVALGIEADVFEAHADVLDTWFNFSGSVEEGTTRLDARIEVLAAATGDGAESLSKVTVPEDARDHHSNLSDALAELNETATACLEATKAGDESLASSLVWELFSPPLQFARVLDEGEELSLEALEAQGEDGVVAYLNALDEILDDFGDEQQGKLNSGGQELDSESARALAEEFLQQIDDLKGRVNDLPVPPGAERVNEELLGMLETMSEFISQLEKQEDYGDGWGALYGVADLTASLQTASLRMLAEMRTLIIAALSR